MKKTFTLYHELLDAPNTKPTLEFFDCEINSGFADNIHDGPSDKVLRNILNYAKAVNVFKTKNAGNIYLVSN
ncbi:MAG: hypothetical protein CVU00_05020 [Bacteroidetes bacterium HGW-Bacteroidetes-17]|jgi:hypothetical protein|nr:MAG: hypothetical protein CVU00_05020 [Bacteroidetes bacterium HGW-Bacteroidetes-17]